MALQDLVDQELVEVVKLATELQQLMEQQILVLVVAEAVEYVVQLQELLVLEDLAL